MTGKRRPVDSGRRDAAGRRVMVSGDSATGRADAPSPLGLPRLSGDHPTLGAYPSHDDEFPDHQVDADGHCHVCDPYVDDGAAGVGTVERSEGVVTGGGLVAGGGKYGTDPTVDARVQEAADVMAWWTGADGKVQIRFNSDRKSGGAWLVTAEKDGVWRNAEVGVVDHGDGLRLRVRRWATKNPDEWVDREDYAGVVEFPVGDGDLAGMLARVVGPASGVQAKVDARTAELEAYGDQVEAFLVHPRKGGMWTDRDIEKAVPLTDPAQLVPGVWLTKTRSGVARVIGPDPARPGSVQVAERWPSGRYSVNSHQIDAVMSSGAHFKVIAGNDVPPPAPLSFDPTR